MQEHDNDNLSRFFQKAANQPQIEYNDNDWKDLERKLDIEAERLASVRSSRLKFGLGSTIAILIFMGIYFFKPYNNQNSNINEENVSLTTSVENVGSESECINSVDMTQNVIKSNDDLQSKTNQGVELSDANQNAESHGTNTTNSKFDKPKEPMPSNEETSIIATNRKNVNGNFETEVVTSAITNVNSNDEGAVTSLETADQKIDDKYKVTENVPVAKFTENLNGLAIVEADENKAPLVEEIKPDGSKESIPSNEETSIIATNRKNVNDNFETEVVTSAITNANSNDEGAVTSLETADQKVGDKYKAAQIVPTAKFNENLSGLALAESDGNKAQLVEEIKSDGSKEPMPSNEETSIIATNRKNINDNFETEVVKSAITNANSNDKEAVTSLETADQKVDDKYETTEIVPTAKFNENLNGLALAESDGNKAQPVEIIKSDGPAKQLGEEETEKPNEAIVDNSQKKEREINENHRWSLVGSFSPDFSSVGLGQYTTPGVAFGLVAHYQLNKRISVAAGIVKSNKRYVAAGKDYNPPAGYWENKTNGVIPVEVNGACNMLEIPLTIQYKFSRRKDNSMFITGGLSSYVMLNETYDYTFQNTNPGAANSWTSKGSSSYLFSVVNISVGYEHAISSRFDVGIEPYIKIPIAEIGWTNIKLFSTGASITLRFNLLNRHRHRNYSLVTNMEPD
jgi:hypothetical protein